MKCGINLYSIRTLISTEKDFIATTEKLKGMGCDYMQVSGIAYDPKLIKKVKDETGMPIVLTHVPMDKILNETEKLVEEHLSFGCHNIGLGSMPKQIIGGDPKQCYELIEKLNKSGEIMEKYGCKFFYHHHGYEFYKYGEKTVFDHIIETAPHINFTADTFWLQYGGAQINDFIKRLAGRIECVHLKDYMLTFDATRPENYCYSDPFMPHYTHIGGGVLDFASIVSNMEKCGVKYYLIEQDDACNYPNPLSEIEMSFKYLKENIK